MILVFVPYVQIDESTDITSTKDLAIAQYQVQRSVLMITYVIIELKIRHLYDIYKFS